MLWKGTKKFGIGFSSVDNDGSKCTYVVARYRPTGNVAGVFRDNVAVASDKRSCTDPSKISLHSAMESAESGAENPDDLDPRGW